MSADKPSILVVEDEPAQREVLVYNPEAEGYEVFKAVYNKYHSALENVSISTEIPIIDLRKLIKSPEQRNIFSDTMHFNVAGAELFGDYIANSLKAHVEEILTRKAEVL